jgi:hypothetical protein
VLRKRFSATKVGQLGDRIVAIESTMESPLRGTKTLVIVHSIENGPLADEEFSDCAIEHG